MVLRAQGSSEDCQTMATELPIHYKLPRWTTAFVGREAELEHVRHLLDTTRLVTLTGPPGIGKTRLASQVAESGLAAYRGGAWWSSLRWLTEPERVLPTVA